MVSLISSRCIRAVVFDVFGTLAEIGERRRPYLRLMKLAAASGRQPQAQADDAAKIMSMDCDIFGVADWLGVEVSDALRAEIEADLAAELASISLFPDALSVIEYLRSQGIKIAVCSNLAKPYAAPILSLLPFPLDAYAWSFEVGAVKPDPAMFAAVCKMLDLPPAEILFVGDSYAADCAGPRAFGMQALHLARNGASPDAEFAVSLLDLFASEQEQPGWQEIVDDHSGERKWIPMPLYEAYRQQQMAMRGLA